MLGLQLVVVGTNLSLIQIHRACGLLTNCNQQCQPAAAGCPFAAAITESFRPERWLELQASPNPYSFPTFNAGPRLCLGQRLAELEGVYVLAGMMAQFRCEQVGPKEVTYAASTTLPIKGGLQVLVKARQAGRRPV